MSDVHFFIDPSGISGQSNAQQFGPVNADEYRVTSTISITGSPMAYAICRGRVLVQPQTSATGVVNLILKPMDQPIEGLNIKYFVYRGLSEADFFTTSGSDKVVIPVTGSSELISKIRAEFTSFHALDPDPEPLFLAKFIGYDPAATGTTMLDDLFFKESHWDSTTAENHFELPMIAKGKSLGKFTGSNCGIDVVINYGDYIPDTAELEFSFDLNYARAAYGKITLTGTDAVKKTMREQIFQFLDIAAFYGYFHPSSGGVGYGILTSNTNKTGNGIYTDLLDKFATKNNLYVYITSDRKRSYNFYNNYLITGSKNTLKKGIAPGTATALTPAPYGTQNGWPVLIDNVTRSGGSSSNALYMQLACAGNNAVLFMTSGKYGISPSSKWILYKNENAQTNSGFTNEIALTVPATGGKNIAGFYFLLYQTPGLLVKLNVIQNVPPQLNEVKPSDSFVFGINRNSVFKYTGTGIAESSFADLRKEYSGKTVLPGNTKFSISESLRIETTIDTDASSIELITFIGYAVCSLFTGGIAGAAQSKSYASYVTKPSPAGGIIGEFLADYESIAFTDNTTPIKNLNIADPTKETNGLFFLGIAKTEKDVLKQVIDDQSLINASICFLNISPGNEPIVSTESIEYSKYRLGILGESGGTPGIYFPAGDIVVFSTTANVFLSKAYGDTIERLVGVDVTADVEIDQEA